MKAPYNFVPLSDQVVIPYWSGYVSHDIPFENSKSGKIRLKIEAKSPIYVRNGVPRSGNEKSSLHKAFNQIDGKYFIPGSSVKGMLRSVVEIMSFGRMKNKVNPEKYSVRDFQNTRGPNAIYPLSDLSQKVYCGWLYKKNDQYFIIPCGKPDRISHKNLDVLCKDPKISEHYKNSKNVNSDYAKSAVSKNGIFDFEKEQRFVFDYENNGRSVYKIDPQGKEGTIVLTGQPSQRKEPKTGKAHGKHLEFIFWKQNSEEITVPEEVINNFFFAYYDHDPQNQNHDWKWRKKELNQGKKIPVFYRKEPTGNTESILDIGLTMLYKITYNNSVVDLINRHQGNATSYDMAETIFGYVDDKKALKGRVQLGHAFLTNNKTPLEERMAVFAGPKASYYPTYIEQSNHQGKSSTQIYMTYMNEEAVIRGWKRYPVHSSSEVKEYKLPERGDGTINYEVVTRFVPLPPGSEFEFDLVYHNLRPEELGALISAITFHHTDGLYHSLGGGKPLGYGKVKMTIEDGLDFDEQVEAMKAYEAYMEYSLKDGVESGWLQSSQLRELVSMAHPAQDDKILEYMDMKKKEFTNAKKEKKVLVRYSELSQNRIEVSSMISHEELQEAEKFYKEEAMQFSKTPELSELKEEYVEEMKKTLEDKLPNIKEFLRAKLMDRRNRIRKQELEAMKKREEQERLEKRKENQAEALDSGFKVNESFRVGHRDAFKNLRREIMRYVQKINGMGSGEFRRKVDEIPVPWLKEKDVEEVYDLLKEIYSNANKRNRKQWNKPVGQNHIFQDITKWIGEARTTKLFEELEIK